MRISRIKIQNFRGIQSGELFFPKYAVLVGDNNCGKSTVIEAIDLCLGPERLSRHPIIDEHDFYAGRYIDAEKKPLEIKIEVVVVDLSDEQAREFRNHLEWWNETTNTLLDSPPPEGTDHPNVFAALRVGFTGIYDADEDDFTGKTYFLSPVRDDGEHDFFRTSDKRRCGFLFLRTLRTGSRALSLERGSLLDIILRLQDKQLQMWEEVLQELRKLPVAEKKELGITDILSSVQKAVRLLVPSESADNPHMRVSDLTRESLRRSLTVFMGTGAKLDDGSNHAAPF
jgi:putative ATP-dependent endonuclease of the OLD family